MCGGEADLGGLDVSRWRAGRSVESRLFDKEAMPVAREKAGKRRTTSSSSDSSLQAICVSPSVYPGVEFEPREPEAEESGVCTLPSEPSAECCNPKGCTRRGLDSQAVESSDPVKVVCSNEKCPFNQYMHAACFAAFEEHALNCLRGTSRGRSWSEKQRKQNLWTKKGYDLISKFCTCKCGKGTVRRETAPLALETAGAKNKKSSRKKSASFGDKPVSAATVRNGKQHSDSTSSESAVAHMQPFAHRTDYTIFQRLVPKHLVNSYHIKMEDDGYGAGDETRSFVLSSLAFHHTSLVSCVLCETQLPVYDKFPLLDGTFYLSPVQPSQHSLEVESKGNEPNYLSAICLYCLVGVNKVTCTCCSGVWNGNHHQIGTMYTYDVFAAMPCCSHKMCCRSCKAPLDNPTTARYSFTQLSTKFRCSQCGNEDYHYINPLSLFCVEIATKK